MTTRTTISPLQPTGSGDHGPQTSGSREFNELESMIAKAGNLKNNLLTSETLENDEDVSIVPLPDSKKMRPSPYHSVESSKIPAPHFSPILLTPNFSDVKKPVALPKPTFKSLFCEDQPASTLLARTPSKLTPPPTPKKRTLAGKESPYELKFQETSRGLFSFNGHLYQIQYLGQGSFSTVYTLVKNPSQLISTVDNSQLVIKVYNGIRTGFNQRALSGYLQSALENYEQVTSLGLPVATIYNAGTASSDLAIIQKRVDANIDLRNPAEMKEVQRFFDLSIKSGILMDLQPANLKVENGTVVLIDFVEESDDQTIVTMVNLAIRAWIELCALNGFSRAETEGLLSELSSGFEKANPYFNAKWLQGLLDG